MLGLMQSQPLLISSLIEFAERHHGDAEIVSRRVEGDIHRYTYRDLAVRARRLSGAAQHVCPGAQVLGSDDVRRGAQHRFATVTGRECDQSRVPELDRDEARLVIEIVTIELGAQQEGVGLSAPMLGLNEGQQALDSRRGRLPTARTPMHT